MVIVHYYGVSATLAQQVIALAQDDLTHPVQDTLGFSLKQPVNVYMYQTRNDFLRGAPVIDAAETGALADPVSNSVYVVIPDASSDGARDDLPHELTHIVFHQNEATGSFEDSYFAFFPLWLNEGLAAYDEPASYVGDYNDALSAAVSSQHLDDFLQNFTNTYPSDPDTDFLAYAESRSFIVYLVQSYGLARLHQFLAGARSGDLDLDAEQVFGASLRMLQSRWEASVGAQPAIADIGYIPAVPPLLSFAPGILPPITSQVGTSSHAPALNGVDAIPPSWLLTLIEVELGLLVGVVVAWMSAWRPRWRARRAAALWAQQGLQRRAPPGIPIMLPVASSASDTPPATSAPREPAVRVVPVLAVVRSVASTPPEPSASASLTGAEAGADPARAPDSGSRPARGGTPAHVVSGPSKSMSPTQVPRMSKAAPGWLTAVLLMPIPFALGAGALGTHLDHLGEWHSGYVTAAIASIVWAPAALYLIWRNYRAHRSLASGMVLAFLLVALSAGASSGATLAGRAQAAAYEQRGAYALALRIYADSGESRADEAADEAGVRSLWGETAMSARDYATATIQLREAIALDPNSAVAATDRDTLMEATQDWGEALTEARMFPQALRVYAAQAAWSGCTASCAAQMRDGIAATYLAQADVLLTSGDFAGALDNFRLISQRYAAASVAPTVRQALAEVPAQQMLQAALATGARGDSASMNAQLRTLVAQYPRSAAAVEAPTVAQPVSGAIRDASGASTAGDRVYFLAFATAHQARSFTFDFNADDSLFKVATVAGPAGAFQVRLDPGYWYTACWEDPSQAAYGGLNLPLAGDNAAFTVRPFVSSSVGVILGY